MGRDVFPAIRRRQSFLRSEHLPLSLILPAFKGRRKAHRGQWVAEIDPFLALRVFPVGRMAVGQGWLGLVLGGLPKDAETLKRRRRVIPQTQAGLIDFEVAFDLGIGADQLWRAGLIHETEIARDPRRPAAGHFSHATHCAFGIAKPVVAEFQRRFERSQRLDGGGCTAGVIDT